MPFRQAHKVVGKIVGYCIEKSCSLQTMSLSQLKEFSELFDNDIAVVLQWDTAILHRDVEGGTGGSSVLHQIALAKTLLNQ